MFAKRYDLSATAPFTLVLHRGTVLEQVVWDGDQVAHTILDAAIPHFWSSVTLYPREVRRWRRSLFERWHTAHPAPQQSDIIEFHRYGGRGDRANDFVMNRNDEVRTLSISSVARDQDQLTFRYLDLRDPANNDARILDMSTGAVQKT